MFVRDLVTAKRRRLCKAAEVRGLASATVDRPGEPLAEEAAKPVVTEATEPVVEEATKSVSEEATGPVVEEATGPVVVAPLAGAAASSSAAEVRPEEEAVVRTPTPPRPVTPPEQQEEVATEEAGSGSPARRSADVEMGESVPPPPQGTDAEVEKDVPPPRPPNADIEGAAAPSEAAAGTAAAYLTVAGQSSPAPEAREEAPMEEDGAGAHGPNDGEGSLHSPQARVDPGPSSETPTLETSAHEGASMSRGSSRALALGGTS